MTCDNWLTEGISGIIGNPIYGLRRQEPFFSRCFRPLRDDDADKSPRPSPRRAPCGVCVHASID
jgi:hypothetical protein